jgi:hypothetical protein
VSMQASTATLNTRVMVRRKAASDASEADLGVLQMLQAAQQPLLPHELVHTVAFLNEANQSGIPADEAKWIRLEKLIAIDGRNK